MAISICKNFNTKNHEDFHKGTQSGCCECLDFETQNHLINIMDIDSIALWDRVGAIALALKEAVPSRSYGTPAFKVNKKLFARLKEDGKTLAIFTEERDKWMKKKPATFFITEHYRNWPMMLIDLQSVSEKDLRQLITASWKMRAPKRLLKKDD